VQVEVYNGNHLIVRWLEEGVADVPVHHVQLLTLGVGIPARSAASKKVSSQGLPHLYLRNFHALIVCEIVTAQMIPRPGRRRRINTTATCTKVGFQGLPHLCSCKFHALTNSVTVP
jgi:hypothetical protein